MKKSAGCIELQQGLYLDGDDGCVSVLGRKTLTWMEASSGWREEGRG